MSCETLSRRRFLQGSGTLAGSALLRGGLPALAALSQAACDAREETSPFSNLSAAEAREFTAIAARIMPTTNTPGATEAGVIYFIDQAFDSFLAPPAGYIRAELPEFQQGVSSLQAGTSQFSELDPEQQDAYLMSVEDTDFFQEMRFLTLAGVFGMAMYGGNRDMIGWKLIGMDGPPHGWVSPFGFYDAEYRREQNDGQ